MYQAYSWVYVPATSPIDADEMQAWCLTPESQPVLVRMIGVPVTCYVEFDPHETTSRDKIYALIRGLRSGLAPGTKGNKDYEAGHARLVGAEYLPRVKFLYESRVGSALRLQLVNYDALRRVAQLSKWGGLFVKNRKEKVPFKVWEADVPMITKFLAARHCQFCQWFQGTTMPVEADDKVSNQAEVWMDPASLTPVPETETGSLTTSPRLFAFDIETYSSNELRFPAKENAEDVITMIACLAMRMGDWGSLKKYILVLKACDPIDGAIVRVFRTEKDLLQGFLDLLVECDPEVLLGFNTQGFDIPYIDTRLRRKLMDWGLTSRIDGQVPYVRVRQTFSDAYGYQTFYLLEQMGGRIHFDLLSIVKRDYKLRSYKLDYVYKSFVKGKEGKHDVTAKEMFRTYAALVAASTEDELRAATVANTRVANYCVQDSMLVLELFHKLHTWISATEMCNVVHCQPDDLYTRGQQMKSKAQLYEAALHAGYIMDYRSDGYPYKGALVKDPNDGIKENIAVLDFASLYPSIIMANNLCYTTIDIANKHPNEHCLVLDFDETFELKGKAAREYLATLSEQEKLASAAATPTVGGGNDSDDDDEAEPEPLAAATPRPPPAVTVVETPHGKRPVAKRQKACKVTRTVHYHFKFLKAEHREGLLPRLVRALVSKRNEVRAQQKGHVPGSLMHTILERRQLALKVSANSIYGFLGVQKNALLPLIQAAIAVTYLGRTMITRVNQFIEDEKGYTVVYNDTDSAFIDVKLDDPTQLRAIGKQLEKEITALFPPPIRIEYEKGIRMLAIKKKKYAYYCLDDKKNDGSFKLGEDGFPELNTKGVISARRDNCKWQVDTFNDVLVHVMDRRPLYEAVDVIFRAIERLLYDNVAVDDLAVNKSVGANYASETAPMKVFADEMKEAGNPLEAGERVDMIVVDTGKPDDPLGKKYRLLDIYREAASYGTAEPLDKTYYVENVLMNCVDQIIEIGYKHLWPDGCSVGFQVKRKFTPVSQPIHFALTAQAQGRPWAWVRKEYMSLVINTYYP